MAIFEKNKTLYKYIWEYVGDNLMATIAILRQIIKNGWTIANRRNIIVAITFSAIMLQLIYDKEF